MNENIKNDKIEIHGRHTSYNVQKVLWLADELNLEYVHFQIGGRFSGNDTTKFRSMNPLGKVPVIRHERCLTILMSGTGG